MTPDTAICELDLTPAQAEFGHEHDAHPGVEAFSGLRPGIFMYHDDPWGTCRWLVDAAGRTLEIMSFLKSPA
jgi:hypothetical protein